MGEEPLSEIDRTISALQDPTRRRILLDFYVHRPERTSAEVAGAVGVHRTVAHGHLERLVALGYLSSSQRRGTAGKPAKLYRLAGRQIDLSYPLRRFARLSALLAEGLKGSPGGIEIAHDAGRRYGASLVSKPSKSAESVLGQLAPLGAEYVLVGNDEVLARNCIFRQACEVAEDVVCELHAGILEGAFQGAGLEVRTEAVRNYADEGVLLSSLDHLGSLMI
jgi:predicted ArsR family transcriptional regulator